jgi:hypothetical protein
MTLFAYDPAKTANIVADMAKLIEFLDDNDVNVAVVVIDNAKNLGRLRDGKRLWHRAGDYGEAAAPQPVLHPHGSPRDR